jgi:sugar O-acyltransferase (sialic acid O-acetyltransferase NeuD family)
VPDVLNIVGSGGHAKVVVATARSMRVRYADGISQRAFWPEIRLLDDNDAVHGRLLLGLIIEGPSKPTLASPDAVAVFAIGSNAVRARLGAGAKCQFALLVHDQAVVDESVRIGNGTVVFAGAVIQPDCKIGNHVIINTGASVDHDCVIGDAVHIAPGARLAGGVTVGARTFIGIGAVVVPGISIGDDVIIGAGAAVIRDIPSGATAVGVPARIITPGSRL